jgi:predicted N-acetyltransferase YhbS
MGTIQYLSDYPEYIKNVSRWLYDEFIHKDNKDLEYEKFNSFFQNNSKTEFPIRLIVISDENCVGTATITENDFPKRQNYTPWLGGLYVDIPYRNTGIGQKLIEFVKRAVKDLGYAELYLVTENAGQYYKKIGWLFVETCDNEFGRICEIYKYNL